MSMIARQTYGPSPEDPRRAVLRPGRDFSKSGRGGCKTLQDTMQDTLQDVLFTQVFHARRSLN